MPRPCTWTRPGLEDRVSLRLGSLLEPVAGEEFELVVSNPPFVITPAEPGRGRVRTSSPTATAACPGMTLCPRWSAALPGVLAPGGTAQLLGNWEITGGHRAGHERPQELDQSGRRRLVHPARAGGPGAVCRDLAAGRLGNPRPAALPGRLRRLPGRLRLPERGGNRLRHDLAAPARRRATAPRPFAVSRKSRTRSSSPSGHTWAPPSSEPTGWPPTTWRPRTCWWRTTSPRNATSAPAPNTPA